MLATFDWIPSYRTSKTVKHKVRKASFGDGYEQVLDNGINATTQEWKLMFDCETVTANDIDAFLTDHGDSQPFLWTAPGDTEQMVVRVEGGHTRTYNSYNHETISVTFVQKFGVRR